MVNLLPQPTGWGVQLEWPWEVGSILEVRSNIQNIVDHILNTDDTELAELTLDDAVGGDSCAVYSDLNTRVSISEQNLPLIE